MLGAAHPPPGTHPAGSDGDSPASAGTEPSEARWGCAGPSGQRRCGARPGGEVPEGTRGGRGRCPPFPRAPGPAGAPCGWVTAWLQETPGMGSIRAPAARILPLRPPAAHRGRADSPLCPTANMLRSQLPAPSHPRSPLFSSKPDAGNCKLSRPGEKRPPGCPTEGSRARLSPQALLAPHQLRRAVAVARADSVRGVRACADTLAAVPCAHPHQPHAAEPGDHLVPGASLTPRGFLPCTSPVAQEGPRDAQRHGAGRRWSGVGAQTSQRGAAQGLTAAPGSSVPTARAPRAGQSVLLPPPSPRGALPGSPIGCTAEGPVACPLLCLYSDIE